MSTPAARRCFPRRVASGRLRTVPALILALLALPANRNARAWWIWLPLVLTAGAPLILQNLGGALGNFDDSLDYLVRLVAAGAFGLAAVALLGCAVNSSALAGPGLTVKAVLVTAAAGGPAVLAASV